MHLAPVSLAFAITVSSKLKTFWFARNAIVRGKPKMFSPPAKNGLRQQTNLRASSALSMSISKVSLSELKDAQTILARLKNGFRLRRLVLRRLTNLTADNVTGAGIGEVEDTLDLHSLSQRFLRKDLPFGHYLTYMQSLLPKQYHDLIIGFYFSGEYVIDPRELLENAIVTDAQLSVLCQTLLFSNRIDHPQLASEVARQVSRLISEAFSIAGIRNISSFRDVRKLLATFGAPANGISDSLGGFDQYVGTVKGELIQTFGPDLFTVFQQLGDPDFGLTSELITRQTRICKAWRCTGLFVQFLLLRATRASERDDPGTLSAPERVVANGEISKETYSLYRAWSANAEPDLISIAAPARALSLMCALRAAVETHSAELVLEQTLNLYNVDTTAMDWVNWDEVYRVMRYSRRLEGLHSCVMHLLMGRPIVNRMFPVIGIAEGEGAFESALRTAVGKLPDRSLDSLCEEIKQMSGNCRDILISALLDRDTATTLSILLQHNAPWAKQLTNTRALAYDIRASALRSDLATALAKHQLLDKGEALTIVEGEQSRLRVAYLQGRLLDGVVHVDWDKVAQSLDAEFAGPVDFVQRMLEEPTLRNRSTYFDGVVRGLAEKIAAVILIDGPDNLNMTISDTLRHGQLQNRFLAGFDRAISHATATVIDAGLLVSELLAKSESGSHWLVELRLDLLARIKAFNTDCLTVWGSSEFRDSRV